MAGAQELARQAMVALSEGRMDDLIAMTHPDVEWRSFFATLGEGGVYRGHEGMQQYVRDLGEAWESWAAEVHDGLEVGELAVLVGEVRFQGRGSGVSVHQPAGWVLRVRGGKIVRFRAFREPEAVLDEVGATPPPAPGSSAGG